PPSSSAPSKTPSQSDTTGTPLDWAMAELEAGASMTAVTAELAGKDGPACVTPLEPRRSAQPFEALRQRAESLGNPPALLVTLGPARDHRARLGFAANFLAAGGFRTEESGPVESPEEAVRALETAEAKLVVLCGSDRGYEQYAEATAGALAEAGAGPILLAGKGGEREPALRAAGVDLFIHLGCNVLEILEQLLDAEEDRA
ncbi:MAG: hypothetical protein SX243_17945, partial [Acidobacteriota bacterium]|nr:hypothetical protein [Acidobacteriota bacterium]